MNSSEISSSRAGQTEAARSSQPECRSLDALGDPTVSELMHMVYATRPLALEFYRFDPLDTTPERDEARRKLLAADKELRAYAERLAALSQPSASTAGVTTSLKAQEQIEDAVVAIMADTWSEFVADTGCFPSDFKIEPGRKLSFTPGSWAHWVGRFVAQRLASSPCAEGERGTANQEGGNDGR